MTRVAEFHDHTNNPFRGVLRIVYDSDRSMVYVEIVSNHDGVRVANSVGMPRAVFSERVRNLGVL